MAQFGNWVAQLRQSLLPGRVDSGFRDSAARPSNDWVPVKHQEEILRLLLQAVDHPDSSLFFFDFGGIRKILQRGTSQEVRERYEAVQKIFTAGIGHGDIVHRYDDLSYFLFFAGAGRGKGAETCQGLWNLVVKQLNLDPAASKGLRLFEVNVPNQDGGPAAALFDGPTLRFSRILPAVPRSDIDEMPAEVGNVGFVYRPLMEVANNLISLFVCIPTRRVGRANFSYGYGVLDDETNVPAIRQLDHRVVGSVASTLGQMAIRRQESLVVVPVHFETLRDPMSRVSYMFACSQRLQQFAGNLVFELIGLPERIPTEVIVNAVAPLVIFSHSIVARVPLDREDLHNYHYSGIMAVGVDAYPLDQEQEQTALQLAEFVERANAQSLKTYVHGIRSLSLSTFVSCCGFDCVGGHALTNAIKAPRAAYLYKLLFKYIAMA